jgi:hypothetical protein
VNDLYAAGVPERRNDTYGAANVVVIVVGGRAIGRTEQAPLVRQVKKS